MIPASALSGALGWVIGLYLALLTSNHVSAHLNPAITIALAIHNEFSWTKVPFFIAVQGLGGFTAAMMIFWNYNNFILNVDP